MMLSTPLLEFAQDIFPAEGRRWRDELPPEIPPRKWQVSSVKHFQNLLQILRLQRFAIVTTHSLDASRVMSSEWARQPL